MRTRLVTALIFGFCGATTADAQAISFAPHRAIYDLMLSSTRNTNRQIERAYGRIAFEFTGNACSGFASKFRQVTRLSDGEGQTRLSDVKTNTWENGPGTGFSFDTQTRADNVVTATGEGKAERGAEGDVSVKLQKPRPQRLDLAGAAVFPVTHLRMLIEQALKGERFLSVKVFDGSDGGGKLYDTTAIIGKEIDAGSDDRIDQVMRQAKLNELRRWPVTLSYFNSGDGERTPVYTMSFDLFENGISGPITFDFGDFSMKSQISKIDLLPVIACAK